MRRKTHEEWAARLVGRMYRYGITAKELARKTGYTAPYISMLLNGKKPASEEIKLKLFNALKDLEKGAMTI